jgi:hypothetical protein
MSQTTTITCDFCGKDAGGCWGRSVSYAAPRANMWPDGNFHWDLCEDCGRKVGEAMMAMRDSMRATLG